MRNILPGAVCLLLAACATTTTPEYKPVVSPAPLPPARTYEKDTDLAEAMRQAIRRHLVAPPGNFSPATEATLDLVIFSDGAVVDVQISKSSGDERLDRAIVRAVRLAQPLPILKEAAKEPAKEAATESIKQPVKEPVASGKSQKYRLVFRPFVTTVR